MRLLRCSGWILSLFLASQSRAAFDAFLKIEGIDGEATDTDHSKWIEVLSFSHGTAKPSPTNIVSFSDLCLLKWVDKASPVLNQKGAQGFLFPTARLELVTTGGSRLRFYEINLTNVLLSTVGVSGQSAGGAARPIESLCLNFGKIGWTYTEYDLKGAPSNLINAWWDIALNRGGNSIEPVLRVTGVQISATELQVTWPSRTGKTYNLLGGIVVTGPFQAITSVTAASDGSLTLSQPIVGGTKFFIIEETP